MVGRFLELYKQVFDSKGQVQCCGRAMCQELIILSNQIEKNIDHGDSNTGMMNIGSITALRQKILQSNFQERKNI